HMHPLAVPSTLFPYTTLFRSVVDVIPWSARPSAVPIVARLSLSSPGSICPPTEILLSFCTRAAGSCSDCETNFWKLSVLVEFPRDRKSTRLNSSHDQISYAVF